MNETWYLALAIFAMALATFMTRAAPFILFSRHKPPAWLIRGARLIPGAVMLVLVLTSLPPVWRLSQGELYLPWAAVGMTAILHLLFRQPLISIVGGTMGYILLTSL